MAKRPIENYLPPVREDGLCTSKAPSFVCQTAVTAGGVLAIGVGPATGPNIYFGSGAPTVSAPQGSLYLRSDGSSVSTRMYVNTNGTTGWTAVTTAT
jgi:hypothetical protein